MSKLHKFKVALITFGIGVSTHPVTTLADINGNPVVSTASCAASIYSAADTLCKLFGTFAGAELCSTTANTCVTGSQEIFVGNQIEFASPTNIKNWTGFGGMGFAYQAANLCLLRDIKDGAVESKATASSPLGNVDILQKIQLLEFNKEKFEFTGYHTAKICLPVFGCLDAYSQKISFKPVNQDLKGAGKKAGEYDIHSAHALEATADGMLQGLKVTIPAITVITPYGAVSAKPEFDFGRGIGMILSPYEGGNNKSMAPGPWGSAKLLDVYGRIPGTNRTETYPKYMAFAREAIDERVIGYTSQIGFGSRDASPKTTFWTPPAGVEYPERPDSKFGQARSSLEKVPNAYAGANVKLNYSPTDMLPEAITNNGFISIDFGIYVQPLIQAGFTSQFNAYNAEIAQGKKLVVPAGPLDYRPMNMEQYKGASFGASSSAASRFALDAGVDLNLHLHVPLPWPFDDIDIDLLNIHPKTTVLEKVDVGYGVAKKSALAYSQSSQILASGEWFGVYNTFNGPVASGKKHLEACFASPTVTQDPPPAPTYTAGNPEDLTKNILYPCNICVATNDYTYEDDKKVKHTIPGFIKTLFPADQSAKPVDSRWACDLVYEAGCYDMCSFNTTTKVLTVVETARELFAAGKTKNMPGRCR